MFKLIFLMGLTLGMTLSASAAEGVVGNGGDIVECPDGVPFANQLLDFYEAGVLNPNFVIDLGGPTVSVEQKVQIYLDRLARVSPVRSLNYKSAYDQFFTRVLWLRGQELQDIDDSAHLTLPVRCKIRQLAIQLHDQRVPGKKFLINQDLWDQLDNDQKTGLILHEIIYAEAVQNGHKNSIKVRKLNAWIASQGFASVTKEEFSKHMLNIQFPIYEMLPGYDRLYLSRIQYSSDGRVERGLVSHNSWIPVAGQWLEIGAETWIEFYPNGNVKSLYNGNHQLLPNGYDLVIQGNRFVSSGKNLRNMGFYENGMMTLLENTDGTTLVLRSSIGNLKVDFQRIELHESGTIKAASLKTPITIQSPLSPDAITLSCVGFDPNGGLNSGCLTRPARMRTASGYILLAPNSYLSERFITYPSGLLAQGYTHDLVTYNQNNQSIILSKLLRFDQTGHIQSGQVTANQFLNVLGIRLPLVEGREFDALSSHIYVEQDRYRFLLPPHDFTCLVGDGSGGGNLYLWPNQALRGCEIAKGSLIELFGKAIVAQAQVDNFLEFYPDGKVSSLYLEYQDFEVIVRGQRYVAHESVQLYPNGGLREFMTGAQSTFTAQSGQQVTVEQFSWAQFDEMGFLIEK